MQPSIRNLRSSILFLVGILGAAGIAMALDAGGMYLRQAAVNELHPDGKVIALPLAAPRTLDAVDQDAAQVAWRYFANNTRAETGWVDSVSGFPGTTLWDQGSYLFALVAAVRLGLIERAEFDQRVAAFLDGFARIKLFDERLPNKSYNTQTLQMVDYDNGVSETGIGWSALDVARVILAFRVLERHAPEFGDQVRRILAEWDLEYMTQGGELWGYSASDDSRQSVQEGRLGYEQYGARAAALWGQDVTEAISARRALEWVDVGGVAIPKDRRVHRVFEAITPIVSEPYVLQGLEMGLNTESAILAAQVYRAQETRHRNTGQLTMVSEDHIDQAPHFLYGAVFGNGREWAVLSEDGEHFPQLRTVSLKAAFGWDALYATEYTRMVRDRLRLLADPDQGWAAGIYEADGSPNDIYTLNTNAVVLEALHFKAFGPLLSR